MPGIVGLITKMPREWAEPRLQRMVKTLCHESFYTSGVRIDESLGVYVAWAERRGSFCEAMPLSNEHGDVHLLFSGEEFPTLVSPADSKRKVTTSARRDHHISFIYTKRIPRFRKV